MVSYKKIKSLSGKVVNLTSKEYYSYSINGEILKIKPAKINSFEKDTYYIVSEEQVTEFSLYAKVLIAVDQGAGRNKTHIHMFVTPDKEERIYPTGE
jgi:hypothetical protein